MTISKLKDLIGLKVVFKVEYDDFQQEVIGIVSNAYLDDFYFNEKNEPMYTSINFTPVEDKKVYKDISEDEYISIFEDTYNLEDIITIIN
jgi:hypothetical protein